MHHFGPYVVSLSTTTAPSLQDLHWAYLSFDEQNDTWCLKSVPASSPTPHWESCELTIKAVSESERINIAAFAITQDGQNYELAWTSSCIVLKNRKFILYALNEEKSEINGSGYHIFGEELTLPAADEIGFGVSDLHVPTLEEEDKERLNQGYREWRKSQLLYLNSDFKQAWDIYNNPSKSIVDRLKAVVRLSPLLSKPSENEFIWFAQLYFDGLRGNFGYELSVAPTNILNQLSDDGFQETIKKLVALDCAPKSLEFFAALVQNLAYEKAEHLLGLPTVQEQISALLLSPEDKFRINLFNACHQDEVMTILSIPAVKAKLQTLVHSAESLDRLVWSDQDQDKKDAIVRAIGIPTVTSWITNTTNLRLVKKNTGRKIFSRLIFDKIDIFAKIVINSSEFGDVLRTLCANDECADTELQQKIKEFVDVKPEKFDYFFSDWNLKPMFIQILSDAEITTERKTTFFKTPVIADAILSTQFLDMMAYSDLSGENKEIFYQTLTPAKIRAFIQDTNGEAFRYLSVDQKKRARLGSTDQEWNNLMSSISYNSPLQSNRDIQPSLFLRIMMHRATPYVGALFLLSGVALMVMMTTSIVPGVSLAAAGGFMLFGSFGYRGERDRVVCSENPFTMS